MVVGELTAKDEFRNTTNGYIGAVVFGPHGAHKGIAVEPRGVVWLTEEEQILTANAPREDRDNPFLAQHYEIRNDAGDVVEEGTRPQLELVRRGVEVRNRRPFGDTGARETGATPQPEGEPEQGAAAVGEEVATPKAATATRRRRGTSDG